MKPEVYKDWRDLVQAYLQACWEDARAGFDHQLLRSEEQFLARHGSHQLREAHEKIAKLRCDSLRLAPAKESYEVIEESANRVVAQVSSRDRKYPYEHLIPFVTTRFLLIAGEAGWHVAGIYYPCVCNNLLTNRQSGGRQRESGKCGICRGKGTTWVRLGEPKPFSPFERRPPATGSCKYCGGTGCCPRCAGEDFPGWRNTLSIYSSRETREGPPAKG